MDKVFGPDLPMTKTVKPTEILNAQGARQLFDDVMNARGSDVMIECDGVKHLGAQALQVLEASRKSWAKDGKAFELSGVSTDVSDAFRILGAPEFPNMGAS